MMCEAGENSLEGMEGNGGSLPKWCENTGSVTYVSDYWAVFPAQHTQPVGVFLRLR